MTDVAHSARDWWNEVLKEVNEVYSRWLVASPLERLRLRPVGSQHVGPFQRIEQRGMPMLLDSRTPEEGHCRREGLCLRWPYCSGSSRSFNLVVEPRGRLYSSRLRTWGLGLPFRRCSTPSGSGEGGSVDQQGSGASIGSSWCLSSDEPVDQGRWCCGEAGWLTAWIQNLWRWTIDQHFTRWWSLLSISRQRNWLWLRGGIKSQTGNSAVASTGATAVKVAALGTEEGMGKSSEGKPGRSWRMQKRWRLQFQPWLGRNCKGGTMFWLQWRRTYEEGLSPSWVRSQGEEGSTSEDSKDV